MINRADNMFGAGCVPCKGTWMRGDPELRSSPTRPPSWASRFASTQRKSAFFSHAQGCPSDQRRMWGRKTWSWALNPAKWDVGSPQYCKHVQSSCNSVLRTCLLAKIYWWPQNQYSQRFCGHLQTCREATFWIVWCTGPIECEDVLSSFNSCTVNSVIFIVCFLPRFSHFRVLCW